jgi:hypothetical protein
MEATNKAAAISQGCGYQGRGYQGCNYQGRGRDGGRSTGVTATLRSIVGATAAAGIPAPPVCPSKMVIRTLPHLLTKWAAVPEIVRCDIWGQKQLII